MPTPHLRAHRYDIPLTEPFRVAIGTVTCARNVLVVARDDEQVGYGEGAPFLPVTGERPEDVEAHLVAHLGHRATRDDPFPGPGLAGGLAVETALLDLEARWEGIPLCTHLSGAPPRPIATSITIPLMTSREAGAAAKARSAAGFTAFKVKAGSGIDQDIERIRQVREAVGTAEIRVDANQGWSREEARDVLPVLRDLDVSVLEQPLPRDDLTGHARLRGHGVPIMLDESVSSLEDAQRALQAGAADRINIKLQKTGSIGTALAIASLAAEHEVPCMLGCMIESRVGILAAAHVVAAHGNIHWADLDGHTFLAGDPVTDGPRIEGGRIPLDGAAGLGIRAVAAGAPVAGTDMATAARREADTHLVGRPPFDL